MNGLTAKKIAKTMNRKQKEVRRGFSNEAEVIEHFGGYLSALRDMNFITQSDRSSFMAEFTRSLF